MTPKDPFVSQLEGYLEDYEGSTPLPEAVRDAIRAELPSTHQRPPWWPARRLPHMNTTMKLVLATAAVVVLAFFGINYLAGQNVGVPGLDDPTASPSPTATPQPLGAGAEGPGTFTTVPIEGQTTRFTFFMPSDWSGEGFMIGTDGTSVLFLEVNGLYSDPCQGNSGATDVPVGSTAEELAAAIHAQTAYDTTAPTGVVIDGYDGFHMSLQMPEGLDYATCTNGEYWTWDGAGGLSEGPNTWQLWILDIDGHTAVLLANETLGGSSAEELDELEQIIQSLDIEP